MNKYKQDVENPHPASLVRTGRIHPSPLVALEHTILNEAPTYVGAKWDAVSAAIK